MKRFNMLSKASHGAKFLQAYYAGERKNVDEWASYLGIKSGDFRTLLTILRKKEFRFHPLPIAFRVGFKKKMGIVVDITENPEFYNSVFNRYQRNTSFPAVKGIMGMMLAGNEKLPQLGLGIKGGYKELKQEVNDFEEKLENRHRNLRTK